MVKIVDGMMKSIVKYYAIHRTKGKQTIIAKVIKVHKQMNSIHSFLSTKDGGYKMYYSLVPSSNVVRSTEWKLDLSTVMPRSNFASKHRSFVVLL